MFNRIGRVRDQAQYDAGIQNHIRENARIGRQRRWLAADPTRDALIKGLYAAAHRAREGSFVVKMVDAYSEWGSLTEGQEAAVRRIVEQNGQRDAQRAQARQREAENSQHIGTPNVREDFVLTIRVVLDFENDFGTMHIHIMHDRFGNVVVYKGSVVLGEKGETITVKATVKEHGIREGVRQTIISRPKVLAVADAAPVPQDAPAAPVAPAIATPEVVEDARPVRGSLSALAAQVEQAAPVVEGPHCHRCGRQTEHHVPYCPVCNPIG